MALLNESVAAGAQTHIIDHDLIARVVNERHGVATVAPAAGQTYQPDLGLGETHVVTLPANGVVTIGAPVSTDAEMQWLPGADLVVVLVSPAGSTATVAWDAAYGSGPAVNTGSTTVARYRNTAVGGAPIWTLSATTGAYTGHGRFTAQSAGDVASIAKGFAGQNVDLAQWQNSAGTVLAAMSSAGVLTAAGLVTAGSLAVSGGGAHSIVGSLTETGQTLSQPSTASQVPQVMRGFTGQTADLTQWQDPTGARVFLAVAGDTGRLNASSGAVINNSQNTAQTPLFVQNSGAVGTVTSAFRRVLNQTADLMQWQDNAGAVLSRVDPAGFHYATGISVGAGTGAGASIFGQVPSGQGAGVAFMLIRDSGGQDIFRVMPTGQTFNVTNSTTTVASIVQGALNQTADLQNWRDSGANVLARVNSAGGAQFSGAIVNLATGSQMGSSTNLFQPGSSTQAAIVAKGLASQSGNLQEWQSSAPAVLASMNSAGQLFANGGVMLGPVGMSQPISGGNGAMLGIQNNSASYIGAIFKAAASQVQDLTVWQNNAGTLMASVAKDGRVTINPGGFASFSPATIDAALLVGAQTINDVPIVARAFSGQVADLQQWQNNAGTVVSTVKSDGTVVVNGSTTDGAPFFVWGKTGTNNGITYRQAGTGNMTAWQSSGGANVAVISSTGNVQGTGAYTTLSDLSAKRNVRELPHASALAAIRQLHPITYDYVDGAERDQVGFVAQDVQAVIPQAVVPWGDGRLGVRSEAILAYLVRAVQELAA